MTPNHQQNHQRAEISRRLVLKALGIGTSGALGLSGRVAARTDDHESRPAPDKVASQPPTDGPASADAGGPYAVPQGQTIQLDASIAASPDEAVEHIEWDLVGDGSFDDARGLYPVVDTAILHGPREQTVAVRAVDGDSTALDTARLSVLTTAPTITVDNGSVAVVEGETATNTGSYSDDDTVTLSTSVGTVEKDGGDWSWAYTTTDGPDESQTVTITATDPDGAASSVEFDLTVTNAAPAISIDDGSVAVPEGELATNSGSYADQGDDVVSLGASVGSVDTDGSGSWSWSYSTTDGPDDSQSVTITATDSDGASSSVSFDLTVANEAPAVAADDGSVTVVEGDTATNTGSYTDPGDDTVSLTASVGSVEKDGTDAWSWSYETTDGPGESQPVTITATDDDGASSSAQFDLQVDNAAPAITVDNGSVTVTEGDTATNGGSFADSGDDTVTISASVGSVSMDGSGSWSWSFTTTDGPDESQTVTITAEDDDGASDGARFELTVENAPPSITADSESVAVIEGETATNSGAYTDPGDDTVSLAASLGTVSTDGGDWSWAYDTTDGPDDSQSVTITATDEDGDTDSVTFDLTVDNAAPVLSVDDGSVTVEEGQTATNTGAYAVPGDDSVSLSASVGSVETDANGNWSWSYQTTDGPDQSQTVTITATDEDGTSGTVSFELTVENAEPAITADDGSVTVVEGETATNSGSYADPGDDPVRLDASVGTVENNGSGSWSWSYPTADGPDDTQTVTITAADDDGASDTTSFELTVENAPPSVTADDGSIAVVEGETAMNSGAYGDPGEDTVRLSASVGSVETDGSGNWTWSYETTDGPDGSQTVTITAEDDEGATDATSFELQVANAAPAISVDEGSVTVTEGEEATNTGSSADPGDDSVSFDASVGTISTDESGRWSWAYSTTDGPDDSQTVTITATDSDGASNAASFDLTVENAAPSLGVDNGAVAVTEGEEATNTGSYADPGDDAVTLTASVGSVADEGSGAWSWSYATTDGPDDSQSVTITATDSDGASSAVSFDLQVANAAPALGVDNDTVTVTEGDTAANSGSYADPGDDTVSLQASVGSVSKADAGTWEWEYPTTDGPDDSQSVTVTATDSDGATSDVSFELTVTNAAPAITVDTGTVTALEGEPATNSGSYTDPGDDTVDLAASVGSVTDDGTGGWSWSYTTTDGPDESQTVTITATDEDDTSSHVNFDLIVENEPPAIAADAGSVTVLEGETATNSGSFADPGDDTVSLSASVGSVEKDGADAWRWSFATTDGPNESQTVTITATDDDGATDTTSFELQVSNVTPSLTIDRGSVGVDEGERATNTGSFVDPGDDAVTIDASVGTASKDSDGRWSWNYTPGDGPADSQTVTVTATDSDGETRARNFSLAVANVPPAVTMNLDDDGIEDEPISLTATIDDPGTADTHTATVDWGDGTTESVSVDQAANELARTHTYTTGGRYSVELIVEDDDGGAATVTDTITITHVVAMDVKPGNGDDTDVINSNSRGLLTVAIHETDEFDVSTVDVSSLRFGAPDVVDAGGGATPAHDGHRNDVDDDGDLDLVLHFEGDMGFDSDDDEAKVVGTTDESIPLFGTDDVRVR